MAASARHETRALLRAHLSAASSYRHFTRHCPICHRLLRLATDTVTTGILTTDVPRAGEDRAEGATEDESPSKA
ncbi:DUF6274 family protein [Streptomyces neyagawaensis]|uniref:DUF6274 family protein n=1 Tax=Streptomyces neyagawaensis TaxID=42238 RepID=UPI0006E24296|nr:DUF6274 family protein [Streptomyces neyagawaensis]MCL6738085.1 DUF6274 family protein [Streptomyces neyagawaensis]MDE1681787.1 DUF6274 family protein [Streptomyces neyagawaensis]